MRVVPPPLSVTLLPPSMTSFVPLSLKTFAVDVTTIVTACLRVRRHHHRAAVRCSASVAGGSAVAARSVRRAAVGAAGEHDQRGRENERSDQAHPSTLTAARSRRNGPPNLR